MNVDASRTRSARNLMTLVLLCDAGLCVVLGLSEAKGNSSAPFQMGPAIWGLLLAAPFLVTLRILRAGEGIDRSAPAAILGWLVGIGLPALMFLLTAISWGSAPSRGRWEPVWYTLGAGLLQLLIPTARRWATATEAFPRLYARTAGILVLALSTLYALVFVL